MSSCRGCKRIFRYFESVSLGQLCVGAMKKIPKGFTDFEGKKVPEDDIARLCLFNKSGKPEFRLIMTTDEAEALGLALIRTKIMWRHLNEPKK